MTTNSRIKNKLFLIRGIELMIVNDYKAGTDIEFLSHGIASLSILKVQTN